MTLKFRPRNEQIQDLAQIASIGGEKLDQLVSRLQDHEPTVLKPAQLSQLIAEVVGADFGDVLVRQIFSLRGLVRRFGKSTQEIVNGLRPWLLCDSSISEQTAYGSDHLIAAFQKVLDCRLVRLSASANELLYDYANLLRNIRILTDIRPLFDDTADSIDAAVISHTLRLQYDSADGEHELSIAMDEVDIGKLQAQCDRALKKSAAARNLMEHSAQVPTVQSGQETGVPQ